MRAPLGKAMRITLLATAMWGLAGTAQAAPRSVTLSPYVEVNQILATQLSGPDYLGDDVVTYTTVAAGIDGQVATRRVSAGLNFRYEHQFGYGRAGDTDRYDGIGRLNVHVIPNLLDFEAGGIATRTRYDIRGFAPSAAVGNASNITQVYSLYAGPSLAKSVGDLDFTAAYRFGYTKVENKVDRGLLAGEQGFGSYNHSTNHSATASVGMRPGDVLPIGWTISGAYSRENTDQLNGRFTDKLVRLDLTYPVSSTLALIGGVGYEKIGASQDTPLFGPGGQPRVDRNGQYISDPTQARLLAYQSDGFYYDAGVVWKPSARTTLIATAGKRYGGLAVTGSFSHQINQSGSIQIGVYNVVDSFGRSIGRTLSGLPTTFTVSRNPFTNAVSGCVFSTDPRAGAGGCFDDSFQSITSNNYRSRGVFALYSVGRGPLRIGVGGGYSEHRYLVPAFNSPLYGTTDKSWSGQVNTSLRISPRTTWENVLQVDYYEPGQAGANDVITGSATTALYHSFTGHLSGTAAAGLYAFDADGYDTNLSGQLLLGARYQF